MHFGYVVVWGILVKILIVLMGLGQKLQRAAGTPMRALLPAPEFELLKLS